MIVTIDPGAPAPVYEQIAGQVVAAVRRGDLVGGDRLPTVRQLAGDLGVAVNTVAKAYKQLEAQGCVVTRGRNGTSVVGVRGDDVEEARAAAVLLARASQRAGLDLAEAVGLLRRAW